jgi:hypothetical protein
MRRAVFTAAAAFALVAVLLVGGAFASHNDTGVKTAKQPFLVPTAAGVSVDPILSVGDIVPNGPNADYQMSGIPDGLGAYKKPQGRWHWFHSGRSSTAVVMMNHELGRSFPQPAGSRCAHLSARGRHEDASRAPRRVPVHRARRL